jgi:antitoxin CcdA
MRADFFDVNARNRSTELQLPELLREEKCRQWQEENQGAINDYNRRVEAGGTFGDKTRRF